MPEIRTEFLFSIALEVPVLAFGETPYGERRIARFAGGSFDGPKLRGIVLPGGARVDTLRHDGVLDIEVRIVLETHDQQMIYMHWKGLRHGPKDVIDRLNRGEAVDPSAYYFRTTPYFETSSEKLFLAQSHLLDSYRLARRRSQGLRCVPSAVVKPQPTGWHGKPSTAMLRVALIARWADTCWPEKLRGRSIGTRCWISPQAGDRAGRELFLVI